MENNVRLSSNGIRKILKKFDSKESFAEYIWNGFDAKADTIHLNYVTDEIDNIKSISFKDNGIGINFDQLNTKFKPFYESEKGTKISSPKNISVMHGKNGVGRLTFFTFAKKAIWESTYNKDSIFQSGVIEIYSHDLNNYESKKTEVPIHEKSGTEVTFYDISISKQEIEQIVLPYLINEFCWFLELNKSKNYSIIVNGERLDYSKNILDYQDNIEINYESSKTKFTIKYIQLKYSLHSEFSKYYYLKESKEEVYKEYTTLNKKGDQYFHSVYIESDFFNNFDFNEKVSESQSILFDRAKSSPEYKFLKKEVNQFLRLKRKPFLKVFAAKLVEKYEHDGILPTYENEWEERYKKPQIEDLIIGLYEAQPKLFNALNVDQKKTFIRLLDLLIDSNERENLLNIINEVVELDTEEREELAKLFETTKLNCVIETIKLIEDRYKTYYLLRDLVFNHELKANEVNHLQKLIESHYWIFGEQYHLVTAAEPKFEEALRRYIFYLTEKDTFTELDHPHKLKEMDIFACRQNKQVNRIENIIIELKHPRITLGQDQFNQVHKYLQVITNQPDFNASNMYWEFYLVGNKFDSTGFMEDLIETNKNHGIPYLILSKDNGRIKVYAKKWSEIFTEFEIKHNFLNERLKLERDKLTNEYKSADEVVEVAKFNSAVQPPEIKLPNGK